MEIFAAINPVAGRGAGLRAWQAIRPMLERAGYHCAEAIAREPLDAWAMAEQAAREGCDTVVAVGGDGTLHEVLNGILRGRLHRPPALAVIPAGTANIFALALGLPKDPVASARLLLDGARRRIDAGQVNDRYFATIAGVGFDAAVVRRASGWPRWIGGKPRHVAAGFLTLATYRAAPARLWLDGRQQTGRLFLLVGANTDWYGGGVHIAPHARVDDGRLSVVWCHAVGRLEALTILLKTFSGTHLHHAGVSHIDAVEIRVDSDVPIPVQADGEDVGSAPAIIRCIPGALEVIVPRA